MLVKMICPLMQRLDNERMDESDRERLDKCDVGHLEAIGRFSLFVLI
jgi:hypothetical protein